MTRAELIAACPEGGAYNAGINSGGWDRSELAEHYAYWMPWNWATGTASRLNDSFPGTWQQKQASGVELQFGLNHTTNTEQFNPNDLYCKDL